MEIDKVSDPILEAVEKIRANPGAVYVRMKKDQADKVVLLAACKCLLADLEGTTELLELDEVPEHIKLSITEGRNAIKQASP